MPSSPVSYEQWREQVERELAGAAFDKVLVHTTADGLQVQPAYAARTGEGAAVRATRTAQLDRFAIGMRHQARDEDLLAEDLSGGADAIWLELEESADVDAMLARIDLARVFVIVQSGAGARAAVAALIAAGKHQGVPAGELRFAIASDPLGCRARDLIAVDRVHAQLSEMAHGVRALVDQRLNGVGALVSTLGYHSAGATPADEIAFALSTGAEYIEALLDAGLSASDAARHVGVQVTAGRDTFGELCKLRALRVCWGKLLAGAGAGNPALPLLHAVASKRTLTRLDPFVNMLRVTTQVFAAILGGADIVTPLAYDEAGGAGGRGLARRVARNTGLILRDESHLGAVVDAAGGAYFFETHTDQLAREAWTRFQQIEREGGMLAALESGRIHARIEASWKQRAQRLAKRQEAIVGVSEFANTAEPGALATGSGDPLAAATAAGAALPLRRDAAAFEELRERAAAATTSGSPLKVDLVTLGPASEHRARLGFARAFFAVAGCDASDSSGASPAPVACLCGSDERYAAEAADTARALRAAGARRVVLAGKPGASEASLREAGVTDFVFMGCDVPAVLTGLLEAK